MDPKLPSNPTAMLMQAQERKHLVNKLIHVDKHVDQREPNSFQHLGSGRVHQRNDEVRKINAENQKMLKKIMGIMNRKPKGNGLDSVPLRRQMDDDFDQSAIIQDSIFLGNADISQIQSNDEQNVMPNGLAFAITPSINYTERSAQKNPFRTEESARISQNSQYATHVGINHQASLNEQSTDKPNQLNQILASSSPNMVKEQTIDEQTEVQFDGTQLNSTKNQVKPFQSTSDKQIIAPSQSHAVYQQKDIQASSMFDKNLPTNESDNKIAFHPSNHNNQSAGDDSQQQAAEGHYGPIDELDNLAQLDPEVLTFNEDQPMMQRSGIQRNKKLFPGQITLNHGIRRQEVRRINHQNMVMLKALKDIKPTVKRPYDHHKEFIKQEQYKRNASKFRNVGRSQPRPRQRPVGAPSQGLPEINRSGSNSIQQAQEDPLKKQYAQRRTSQGNRSYLEPNKNFSVPVSQRTHYRNQRMNVNSNNAPDQSEFQDKNDSTRQATNIEDVDGEMITDGENSTIRTTYPLPKGQPFAQNENQTMGSIYSQDQQSSIQSQSRRPSYLDKLKKSPLLVAMTHHKIPRSIVNRVITQKEQNDRSTFRKYGVVPPKDKTIGNPTEKYNLPMGTIPSINFNSENSGRRIRPLNARGEFFTSDTPSLNNTPGPIDVRLQNQYKPKPLPKKQNSPEKTQSSKTPIAPADKAVKSGSVELLANHEGVKTIPDQKVVEKVSQQKEPVVESDSNPKQEFQIKDDSEDIEPNSEYTPLSIDAQSKERQANNQFNDEVKPALIQDQDSLDAKSAQEFAQTKEKIAADDDEDLIQSFSDPKTAQKTNQASTVSLQDVYKAAPAEDSIIESDNIQASTPNGIEAVVFDSHQQSAVTTPQGFVSGENIENDFQDSNEMVEEISQDKLTVTNGSAQYSLPDDSHLQMSKIAEKKKEGIQVEDEEYSEVNDDFQEEEFKDQIEETAEEYSDEPFDEESPYKKKNSQEMTKTEIRQSGRIENEQDQVSYQDSNEIDSEPTYGNPAVRQTTFQIGEEINPLYTQNTGEIEGGANAMDAFPRQATFDINEEIFQQQNSQQNNAGIGISSHAKMKITNGITEDENLSDTKTIAQSKSMAATKHGIKTVKSEMNTLQVETKHNKLGKVSTEYDVAKQGLINPDSSQGRITPGNLTAGTGMHTSKGRDSGNINQSKENIILSEQGSSIKQLE